MLRWAPLFENVHTVKTIKPEKIYINQGSGLLFRLLLWLVAKKLLKHFPEEHVKYLSPRWALFYETNLSVMEMFVYFAPYYPQLQIETFSEKVPIFSPQSMAHL